MRKLAHVLWIVPAIALGLFLLARPVSPAPIPGPDPVAVPVPVPAPASGSGLQPPAPAPAPETDVAEREVFIADGWTIVQAPEPDRKLTEYDPALLDGREPELREQIASTLPRPDHTPKLADIARRAAREETRTAAVEALGRIGTPAAYTAMLDLLDALRPDDPARTAIVPLVRPSDLDDPIAARMARLIDARFTTDVEKKQLAFTLALVSLRDGTTLPDEVQSALSPSARESLEHAREIATKLPAPHTHGEQH